MMKVLIIEDEPQVLSNLEEILQLSNFETLTAASGLIGLEMAKKKLPNLIICDILMPELDGYSLLSALRQEIATANIPFIFLTAMAEHSDFRQGMELGADDYLTKPFTPQQLLKAIYARLEKQKATERLAEEKLMTLRKNLAHMLPHELNTPLNGILGMSELLIRKSDLMNKSEGREMIETIYTSAHRLLKLTKKFQLYSKLESIAQYPKQISQLRQSSVRYVAKSIITNIALKKAREFNRESDLQLDIQESTVRIPETEMIKLVEEIIENAFKFSLPGTEVKVTSYMIDNKSSLDIIDCGRGMTASQINNIGAYMQFDRQFYEQQGAGLGLAIVRRILDIYDGEFRITSVPHEQTIVRVLLPS
jgi:two-component system, sensor histidine kinase and response regulator